MKKKSVQNMKRTGMLEKKQIFGIRKLNVGVASVGIAAALFLSGAGQLVQAEEVVLPASTSSTTLSEQDGGAVEATTTAIEATDSMVAEATAVTETADATAPEEAPIEEGSIRLHFEM
ncbi:YSIRK-type signal peptide-containing protein [Streptococcus suis]|uniref:YSIRK-type signal peptide-containing protein n=1 Tax=Streptococcus suis TaxID=1307 RepID=UPI000B2DB43F